MDDDKILNLILLCIPLSLVSFGGGQSIIATLQQQTVDVQNMMSGARFTDLYAISRAAPGPGTMIVSLLGWEVGGIKGAILATLAIFIPSSLLVCVVGSFWQKQRKHPWAKAVEKGLAPVAVGLIFAGVYAVGRAAAFTPLEICTTIVTVLFMMRTKIGAYPLLGVVGLLYFSLSALGTI